MIINKLYVVNQRSWERADSQEQPLLRLHIPSHLLCLVSQLDMLGAISLSLTPRLLATSAGGRGASAGLFG